MKTTIISHIYNEEYLLPFWLEHHKSMFDHGIIIDYRSTDSSVDICKKICPSWTVITSRNLKFGTHDIDSEVMDIEAGCEGIKIALNTTEFLFAKLPIANLFTNGLQCFTINSNTPYSIVSTNPSSIGDLITNLLKDSVRYIQNNRPGKSGYRFIHNHTRGEYHLGRHITNHSTTLVDSLQIVWLGYFPWNQRFIERKLQIKNNMTESDKREGFGYQHLLTAREIEIKLDQDYIRAGSLKDVNINLYNMLNSYKPKIRYRAIILILASNFPNNKMQREVWKQYMFRDSRFKVIFIYGKSEMVLTDYNDDYDIISENIKEGMGIAKVLEAFKIIEQRFSYDYLVRTNLSTFWDFEKLHKHLDTLPSEMCYSGDGPLPDYNSRGYYLSGVDTIVSKEMISSININNNMVDINRDCEDQAMGLYFHGTLGAPMLPNRICFFEDITRDDQVELIRTRIDTAILSDKDHYRVKNNRPNRETLDRSVYKELLKKIYSIDI